MSTRGRAPDVLIIGGGVIGLAVAWRAAARGLAVTLLERDGIAQGTSRVAAGMIAPIAEASPSEPALLALSRASAAAYPAFVEELVATGAPDPGYHRFGTLLAARDRDEAAVLERELAFRQGLGLPVRRLLPSEARALEPSLAPTLRLGMEIPDDHAVDPRALAEALAVAFRAAGGELRCRAGVQEILVEHNRVRGVRLADGERLEADRTVVAAGPWSTRLPGLPLEARVPLRPVKGQIILLRDPAGPGLFRRVLRMQPGYLVPRGDGRYVLGATTEERGFDTTVTAAGAFEMLRDAIDLVPGVGELVIEELMAGIRPGTPDNGPILGPGVLDGLLWATGHHRHGILLAPVTAEILAGALCGEELGELAEPFRATRFAPLTAAVSQ